MNNKYGTWESLERGWDGWLEERALRTLEQELETCPWSDFLYLHKSPLKVYDYCGEALNWSTDEDPHHARYGDNTIILASVQVDW